MYQIEFTETAETDIRRLDKAVAQRVLKRLRWLAENFDFITPEVLRGPWEGVWKFRLGDYRILYTCDKTERKLIVHFVRHRREVYQ